MSKQRQAEYLRAMGIPTWVRRLEPVAAGQAGQPASEEAVIQLAVTGSGRSGWLWVLPGTPAETQLLANIKQAVEGDLEGAELCIPGQSEELNIRGLIDEYLITRVVAFGQGIVQQLEQDRGVHPWPESVVLIKAPGLAELEQSKESKRHLWQQLKQHKEPTP